MTRGGKNERHALQAAVVAASVNDRDSGPTLRYEVVVTFR